MKKYLLVLLVALLALFALLAYRTATMFPDRQPAPATGLSAVQIDRDAAVRRFAGALQIPTVSHDDRSNFDGDVFRAFHAYLQTTYPRVHERTERAVVNDYSLVYHLPGSDPALPPVLLMSHMDVVPVQEDTLADWTHPPFAGTVADGMVWGRGSLDDKIGVIGLLEALEMLLESDVTPQRSIYLAFGHDEEVSGKDGAQRIAEYFRQQGIRFDFVMDEGGAVTQGLLAAVDRPVAVIGVSEKGYLNLTLTVEAPGGHSSQPPKQTALGILSRAIVRVEDNPFPPRLDPVLQTFAAIGSEASLQTRLVMGNLWLFSPLVESSLLANPSTAAGIRTTTAATMASGSPKANILPTRATAVINFRILPGDTVESVRQRVVELIADERVSVSAEYAGDPSPVSPTDTRGYALIASTIRALDGNLLVAPYNVQGGTDAKYFHDLSPNVYRFVMVRATPETMKFVHGIDEHVPIEDYLQAIRFYYHLLGQAMET